MSNQFLALFGVAIGILAAPLASLSQVPIPQQENAQAVPVFSGQAAAPKSIDAPAIPSHPFMGLTGWSNMHNDPYMSDTYATGGPLGAAPMTVLSSYLGTDKDPIAVSATITFDSKGCIVTASPGVSEVRLYLLDPNTLKPLAKYDFPSRTGTGTDISAGGYFFLDQNDRALVPVGRAIQIISHDDSSFTLDREFDLTGFIPDGDAIGSTLPDYEGRLWFVTKGGLVGTIDRDRYPAEGSIAVLQLEGEKNENSFSIDETGGVFIASDRAVYRFDAGEKGEPIISWREAYDRGSQIKPGQFGMGTGTTPTLMGSEYVTLADNAEPQMHVLVYRRAKSVEGERLACSVPVFQANSSCTENSLIATDRSIVVENNYGYLNYTATTQGQTTAAGMTRIDLDDNGEGHVVWTNEEHIPSVVSKMSLANGLIYTYTKDAGPGTTDAWYFTAVDFETGKTVYKQLAGTGVGYNNHYAGVYLGPDGKTAYVGVMRGVVAIRDNKSQSGFMNWNELRDAR